MYVVPHSIANLFRLCKELESKSSEVAAVCRPVLMELFEVSFAPARAAVGLAWTLAPLNDTVRKSLRTVLASTGGANNLHDGSEDVLSKAMRHSILRAFTSCVAVHVHSGHARQVRCSAMCCRA